MKTLLSNSILKKYLEETFKKNLKKIETNRNKNRFEIHATDIAKMCLRKVLIAYKYKIDFRDEDNFSVKSYLTFRIGKKIEDILKEVINAKKTTKFIFRLKDIYIIGSPDIIYKNFIIECKSIRKDAFNNLIEPLPEHVLQLSIYLWMAEKYKKYYKTGAIVYIPKEEADDVIKVFTMELNDKIRKRLDNFVSEIREFLNKGVLPAGICKGKFSSQCKLRNICKNGGKYVVQ